jgi:hypothetical protein
MNTQSPQPTLSNGTLGSRTSSTPLTLRGCFFAKQPRLFPRCRPLSLPPESTFFFVRQKPFPLLPSPFLRTPFLRQRRIRQHARPPLPKAILPQILPIFLPVLKHKTTVPQNPLLHTSKIPLVLEPTLGHSTSSRKTRSKRDVSSGCSSMVEHELPKLDT